MRPGSTCSGPAMATIRFAVSGDTELLADGLQRPQPLSAARGGQRRDIRPPDVLLRAAAANDVVEYDDVDAVLLEREPGREPELRAGVGAAHELAAPTRSYRHQRG